METKKKKLSLSWLIMIGLVLGIGLGALIAAFEWTFLLENIIQPIGIIFLNLLKMIIVPLVFTSLVASITNVGDMQRLGQMGKKTLVYYLCTTILAAIFGLGLALIVGPGKNVNLAYDAFSLSEKTSFGSLIVDIVPANVFKALTEGNMMQIVIFSIFFGIAITSLGDKAKMVKDFNAQCADVIFKIVGGVMKTAPVAVCALIADVVATNGMEILLSLIKLVLVILGGCILQLGLYGVSFLIFKKESPVKFYKAILPAQIFSFTTASSAATLPISMKCAKEDLKVSDSVANFVLNLGSTVNMDGGAIYQAACAIFVAQIYGVNLTFPQIIIVIIASALASIGAAAIPGTVIVMMTLVLSSVGLPLEAIALIAGVDRILDMMTTSINVSGDLSACVFVEQKDKV